MDKQGCSNVKNATTGKEDASANGLPFRSKTFYLDLRGYSGTRALTENIQLLGGTVEAFLSKEISCVITNRAEGKREIINGNKTPCMPSPMCNTSLSSHKSESPMESGGEKRLKLQITSRGAALLEKAIKTDINGSSDVLQNARKWGVAVMSLDKILSIVEKYKNKLQLRRNLKRKRASKEDLVPVKTTELKHPFLKIETTDMLFAPTYIEFPRWPVPTPLKESVKDSANSAKLQKSKEVTNQTREKFCEICSSSFNQMLKHVESARHRQAVERNIGFLRFDKLITDSHNLDSYLSTIESDFPKWEEMRCYSPVSEISDAERWNVCTTESVRADIDSERCNDTCNHLNATPSYSVNKPQDVEIDVSTLAVNDNSPTLLECNQSCDVVLVNGHSVDALDAAEIKQTDVDVTANTVDVTLAQESEPYIEGNIHNLENLYGNDYELNF